MRTLLIDADSLIYAAASSNETATQWDEDTWTYTGNFDAARAQLDGSIRKLGEKLAADFLVLALTDSQNWRKEVLPTYKSNRKDQRKPVLLKPLRDYCNEVYTVFQRPGLEADDVVGILATAVAPPSPVVGERIVCSIDKDMKTVPGRHYNWDHDTELVVSVEEADRFHMLQALTGDRVDGYSGCPGVGPVKAEKILGDAKTVTEMWPRVVEAYAKAGLGEDIALTMARVARICRATDYDFKKKEVRLWSPSSQA